jgi:hypothetical protein
VLVANVAWTVAGVALGVANTVRHRLRGYRNPRPFGPADIERNVDYCIEIVDRWQDAGLRPEGLRILELGPGPDLGTGFVLAANGATSYTALDRFALAAASDPAFYRSLGDRLHVDVEATMGKIRYVVATGSDSHSALGPFDAFVSNATLEHLPDVRSMFTSMASTAEPGAIHVHVVDAQTHMRWVRTHDPWNILRYPGWLYRLVLSFPGAPNRLLASDYVADAKAAGIELSVVDGSEIDADALHHVRPFLARPFRDRADDDLRRLTFTLVGGYGAAPAADLEPGSPD